MLSSMRRGFDIVPFRCDQTKGRLNDSSSRPKYLSLPPFKNIYAAYDSLVELNARFASCHCSQFFQNTCCYGWMVPDWFGHADKAWRIIGWISDIDTSFIRLTGWLSERRVLSPDSVSRSTFLCSLLPPNHSYHNYSCLHRVLHEFRPATPVLNWFIARKCSQWKIREGRFSGNECCPGV